MEEAITSALRHGWIVSSLAPTRAVFTYPASTGMDMAGHVVLLVLSVLTCGFALPLWLGLYAYYTITAREAQTLIIRDTGTAIVEELISR
jgi:hypothetical protein